MGSIWIISNPDSHRLACIIQHIEDGISARRWLGGPPITPDEKAELDWTRRTAQGNLSVALALDNRTEAMA